MKMEGEGAKRHEIANFQWICADYDASYMFLYLQVLCSFPFKGLHVVTHSLGRSQSLNLHFLQVHFKLQNIIITHSLPRSASKVLIRGDHVCTLTSKCVMNIHMYAVHTCTCDCTLVKGITNKILHTRVVFSTGYYNQHLKPFPPLPITPPLDNF